MSKIVLSFTEGRVIRDLFYSGFVENLIQAGNSVHIFTPATKVPSFTAKWNLDGVRFYPLDRFFLGKKELRTLVVQNNLVKRLPRLLPLFGKIQNSFLMPYDTSITQTLREIRPDLVTITNPLEQYEYPVFSAAKKLKIPTLGVIRSWDNLYKGLRIRPDRLAVWNQINKDEACSMMKYAPDKVFVIGATQFDPYFAEGSIWTREQLAGKFDLDPAKPIITLAALGPFQPQYDETYLVDWLLAARDSGDIPQNSQIICRLHPGSRLEQFLPYLKFKNIRLSYMTEYIPTLAWSMTREEVIQVGNLLRHSDVVISPGSTITIETAIFDTPTIVPIFHTYQPEVAKRQYSWHLANHFGRLRDLNLVPIIERSEDLAPAIRHALADPSWYRDERKRLVEDYIQFTDGKSSERLIALIQNLVKNWYGKKFSL